MSINTAAYDSAFLRASYLASHGQRDEALHILTFINKEISDEYVVLKMTDILLSMGDSNKAMAVLNDAVATPELKMSDKLFYQKAKIHLSLFKEYDEAIEAANMAIQINEQQDYLKLLATAYIYKKDYASAISAYDRLLDMENNSDYYYQRGQLYLNLGLSKNSIRDYETAVSIDNHTKSLLSLSEIFINKRDYAKAIEYLEKVSDSKTIDVLVKYKLGQLYLEEKRVDEAIILYEDIKPEIQGKEKYYLLKQLAKLYFEKGDYEKAQKYFVEIVKETPNDIQAIYFAGITSEALQKKDVAAGYYEKALSIRSDYAQVLKRLAFIRFQEKDLDGALTHLENVNDLEKDVEYYRLTSMVYAGQELKKDQEKTLKEGIEKFKDNEELLMDYAFLLETDKKYTEAEEILKHLVDINPANATALNFLGYMYADQNIKLDDSYSLIKEALKLEPDNSAYLDSMAWVLYRKGDFEKAYQYQLRALKKMPDEVEVINHMKAILKALGSKKTIKDVLQEK